MYRKEFNTKRKNTLLRFVFVPFSGGVSYLLWGRVTLLSPFTNNEWADFDSVLLTEITGKYPIGYKPLEPTTVKDSIYTSSYSIN